MNSKGRARYTPGRTIKHAQPNRGGSKRPPKLFGQRKPAIQRGKKQGLNYSVDYKIYLEIKIFETCEIKPRRNNIIRLNKKSTIKRIFNEIINSTDLKTDVDYEIVEDKIKK